MKQSADRSSPGAVDLEDLLARVENDQNLLCELIVIFKEELPPILQSLQESVGREDFKSMETSSHALKGILSGLSATRAAALASRLEQMAREQENQGLADILTRFEAEVAELLPELDMHAQKAKS